MRRNALGNVSVIPESRETEVRWQFFCEPHRLIVPKCLTAEHRIPTLASLTCRWIDPLGIQNCLQIRSRASMRSLSRKCIPHF